MARGLIEKRTLANGARSGHPECGIFFSAAIAMFDRLQSMADTAERERKEHARLRRLRSTHLRHVRSALCELAAIEASAAIVTPVMTAVSGWPSNDRLKTFSLDALRTHETEARALARDVTDLLSKIETTSGEPHRNFPSHIQDSTEDSNLSCSEGRVERTSGEPSEDFSEDPASDEARKGRGKKDARPEAARKNKFIETLTPERLYAICPEPLRWQLDIERGAGRDLTVHDFDCAVQALLPMHGISDDAYREAFETMGPQLTTFCLVITYARADNPDDPLRAPGGYLRSLTRACRAGELNIAASIFGLANRSASETPRKLVPRPRRHENPDSSTLQPVLDLMRRSLPRSTLQ